MSVVFGIFIALTILCIAAAAAALWLEAEGLGFVAIIGLIVCVVFWIVALAVIPLSARYEHAQCERFGIAVEREVEFVRYSHWSWDCLVRTDEGLVPRSQWYVDEGHR